MTWAATPTFVAGTIFTAGNANILSNNLTALANSIGLYDEVSQLSGSAPSATVPGNFYPQCGIASGGQTGFNFSVTFPTAFVNGVGPILLSPTSVPASTTGASWSYSISAASRTGFTVTASISGSIIGFSWLAVGF